MCNTLLFWSNNPDTDHNKEGGYLQQAQTFDPQPAINLQNVLSLICCLEMLVTSKVELMRIDKRTGKGLN